MKNDTERFGGKISDDYRLIEAAMPDFPKFQSEIGTILSQYRPPTMTKPLKILEIGCGDGYTTKIILDSRPDIKVIAIDNEPKMLEKAQTNLRDDYNYSNLELVEADVLNYLKRLENNSFDAIVSAMTYHNWHHEFRKKVLLESYRVLKCDGIFINADKYVEDRKEELYHQFRERIEKYFDVFMSQKKYELLQEWVLHEIDDMAPERLMPESKSVSVMKTIGFKKIDITGRYAMEAVLVAYKYREASNEAKHN